MKTIRKEVIKDPYVPVWFGATQKGMVADNEVNNKWFARQLWLKARYLMCGVHWVAEKIGAHKEWANRLLNPWQFVRETITATEWDNLYNLRLHKDAQKDITEVVNCIYKAHKKSLPRALLQGEWHTPYVKWGQNTDQVFCYLDNDGKELTTEEAIKCSTARCARSSYDNHDGSSACLEKDLPLYQQLIDSDPKHASPVENPCTPMDRPFNDHGDEGKDWPKGATHLDINGNFWSGNLKGFVQYRQLLQNHTCTDYKPQK